MNKLGYKFYPLAKDEWVQACKELKPAERDILYYIRSSDPYNKGIEISITEMGRELGRDKSTVSRALKALDAKGFIDLELVKVKATVTGKGVLSPHNAVVSTQQEDDLGCCLQETALSPHNPCCVHTTGVAPTQRSTSESLTESKVQEPKIFKEFKDLSLSESAIDFSENAEPLPLEQPPSEELIGFVISQIGKGANNPRAYARAAIQNDREYWLGEFEKSKQPVIEETPQTMPLIAEPFGVRKEAPPIEVVNDRDAILARAAGILEMGKSPSMAKFAQQRLKKMIDDYSITPEELKAYLRQKTGESDNFCEVVHPMEVPRLADSDYDQEYADRCKAAQWKHFTDLEF